MTKNDASAYKGARRTVLLYLAAMLGLTLVLVTLHWFFSDIRAGRVSWFNLDKERNFSTWFNGTVYFLFGCTALAAYYWECRRNAESKLGHQQLFRLPVLWIVVALGGLYMSLDEMTILHENLYWKDMRPVYTRWDMPKYLTQWQVLFAPAIVLALGYFILFFSNRFKGDKSAWRFSLAGISCWVGALLLEGVRGTFKQLGKGWYSLQVVIEEELEMIGGIFLLTAITFYVLSIALDFTEQRQQKINSASRFLTGRALAVLVCIFCILAAYAGVIIYLSGHR